ncbi:MAG: LptA/OstA family protein, partial [Thiobacillus sp.]|nr:LptA/OstA family protein [Thiobacillus sp.]
MPTLKIVLSAALYAALLVSPAHAEKADRDKPVNIEANTVTLDDIKKISIYQGNVILSQGTLMLRA